MNYLVGDVQGCADALDRLLAEIAFSPSRDRLYLLGDLVNRGPAVARDAAPPARPGRGSHLRPRQPRLASARRRRRRPAAPPQRHARRDPRCARPRSLARVAAPPPDGGVRARLADAARRRRAAVGPDDVLALARALEAALRERPPREFLGAMFGNEPARWSDSLAGDARLRFTLNALARIRFVTDDGMLEFTTKDGADGAPPGFHPWFDVPGRADRRRADRVRSLVRARTGRAAPTCSASTPAASGAASSPPCGSTAVGASSSRWLATACSAAPESHPRRRPCRRCRRELRSAHVPASRQPRRRGVDAAPGCGAGSAGRAAGRRRRRVRHPRAAAHPLAAGPVRGPRRPASWTAARRRLRARGPAPRPSACRQRRALRHHHAQDDPSIVLASDATRHAPPMPTGDSPAPPRWPPASACCRAQLAMGTRPGLGRAAPLDAHPPVPGSQPPDPFERPPRRA